MRYLSILAALLLFAFTTQAKEAYIENKGQIIDQNRIPNPSVLYLYNGKGLNVQLRKTGFSYDVWKSNADSTTTYNRIDIDFVNRSAAMRTATSGASNDYLNYYTEYTGMNGVTHVRNYSEVTYQNVWNGIDVQFVLNGDAPGGTPKYNFILHAGAKLSDIKLDIKGANSITQKNNGLILATNLSDIEESVPNSYYSLNEQKTNAHANFIKNSDGTYGLNVAENIPANAELVIDPLPLILWGSYYGGSDLDQGLGSGVDNNGNVYITGQTASANTIATTGAFQISIIPGTSDVFIAKLDAAGKRAWGTYYGGARNDGGISLAVTKTLAAIFVCGVTTSPSVFATTGAAQAVNGDTLGGDVFLAMFDNSGMRQWSTYFGGVQTFAFALDIDSLDNAYITGDTRGSNLGTPGVYHPSIAANVDGFVAKYSAQGAKVWFTYYGGERADQLEAIKVFKDHVYVAGYTPSVTNIASINAYQPVFAGGLLPDACIAAFDLDGQGVWSTYLGGTGFDDARTIFVDSTGVYVGGNTSTVLGFATPNAYQSFWGGSTDGFLAKLDLTGNSLFWNTYYGGSSGDNIHVLTGDKAGNIVAVGQTNSPNNIATPGTLAPTFISSGSFISSFSKNGALLWGSYYPAVLASKLAVDNNNIAYLYGTASGSAIGTPGTYQPLNGGNNDAFVVKFSICDTGLVALGYGLPLNETHDTLHLYANGGNKYYWTGPNNFTSTAQNPVIFHAGYTTDGIYTVTATDSMSNCSETKSMHVVGNWESVSKVFLGSFSLYPNPTAGTTQIDLDLKQQQSLSVIITDITGKTVYSINSKTYHAGKNKIELDARSLAAGTYICRLANEYGNTVWSGKMVRE
jgi:hypothetical protein